MRGGLQTGQGVYRQVEGSGIAGARVHKQGEGHRWVKRGIIPSY